MRSPAGLSCSRICPWPSRGWTAQPCVFPSRASTASGVPVYGSQAGKKLFDGAQGPTSSGGDQVLAGTDGWTISTVAMQPFAPQSLGGAFKGRAALAVSEPLAGLARIARIAGAGSRGRDHRDDALAQVISSRRPEATQARSSASTATWATCICSPPMGCSSPNCSAMCARAARGRCRARSAG